MTLLMGHCLDQRHEDHPFGCPGIKVSTHRTLICPCSCHGPTSDE